MRIANDSVLIPCPGKPSHCLVSVIILSTMVDIEEVCHFAFFPIDVANKKKVIRKQTMIINSSTIPTAFPASKTAHVPTAFPTLPTTQLRLTLKQLLGDAQHLLQGVGRATPAAKTCCVWGGISPTPSGDFVRRKMEEVLYVGICFNKLGQEALQE